mgnify:CR=1 FL=1|tara:strand:+ start:1015 stop:1455 length:441 start_codon:yes stop_codon:yes gene_type:complete
MMTLWLVIAVSLMCFVVKDEDIFSMSVFCVANLLFQIVAMFSIDVGLWLFGAFLDVCVMITLAYQVKISKISLLLMSACAVSVTLNFSGWVMYESYMEPYIYNLLYDVFYGALFIILVKGFTDEHRTISNRVSIFSATNNSNKGSL